MLKKYEFTDREEFARVYNSIGETEAKVSVLDEDGNLTPEPPDPTKKKKEIKLENIILGAAPVDNTPVETVREGQVKFFNDEKGYGFINDKATKESIFVHINNVEGDLRENDRVTFEIENGPKGPNAVNVKLI